MLQQHKQFFLVLMEVVAFVQQLWHIIKYFYSSGIPLKSPSGHFNIKSKQMPRSFQITEASRGFVHGPLPLPSPTPSFNAKVFLYVRWSIWPTVIEHRDSIFNTKIGGQPKCMNPSLYIYIIYIYRYICIYIYIENF